MKSDPEEGGSEGTMHSRKVEWGEGGNDRSYK